MGGPSQSSDSAQFSVEGTSIDPADGEKEQTDRQSPSAQAGNGSGCVCWGAEPGPSRSRLATKLRRARWVLLAEDMEEPKVCQCLLENLREHFVGVGGRGGQAQGTLLRSGGACWNRCRFWSRRLSEQGAGTLGVSQPLPEWGQSGLRGRAAPLVGERVVTQPCREAGGLRGPACRDKAAGSQGARCEEGGGRVTAESGSTPALSPTLTLTLLCP